MPNALELVSDCAELAPVMLSLGRDNTDAYDIRLAHNERCDAPAAIRALAVSDLVGLLPSGSSWRPALGWRSFFGLPLTLRSMDLFVFGATEILPHATRGAFPVVRLLVFPGHSRVPEALDRVLHALSEPETEQLVAFDLRGVLTSKSASPSEHVGVERQILTAAQAEISGGSAFLFRTLLLAESELRLPGHPAPPLFARVKHPLRVYFDGLQWLLATVPALKKEFPWIVQKWLGANRTL